MNRNKKTKNVKQNKAIDNIVEKTAEINAAQTTFKNQATPKNK